MIIGSYTQQPAENLDYDIDYALLDDPFLASGDTIVSVVSSAAPSGLSVAAVVVGGTKVKLFVSGGEAGTSYKVTVTVTTALGRIKQDEIRFRIREF